MKVEGEREFTAPRETVWEVLNDPTRLAKTMPGVESFDVADDGDWRANLQEAHGSGMALGARASSVEALERAYRSVVQNLNENDRVLIVAERAGEIVGMAQLARSSADNARHRAEVQRVAVAADVRGAGVGKL